MGKKEHGHAVGGVGVQQMRLCLRIWVQQIPVRGVFFIAVENNIRRAAGNGQDNNAVLLPVIRVGRN